MEFLFLLNCENDQRFNQCFLMLQLIFSTNDFLMKMNSAISFFHNHQMGEAALGFMHIQQTMGA